MVISRQGCFKEEAHRVDLFVHPLQLDEIRSPRERFFYFLDRATESG